MFLTPPPFEHPLKRGKPTGCGFFAKFLAALRFPLSEGARGSLYPGRHKKNPRQSQLALPWIMEMQKFGLENYPPHSIDSQ